MYLECRGHVLTCSLQVEAGVRKNSIPGCSAKDSEPTGRKDCYFCGGTHAVLVPYEKVTAGAIRLLIGTVAWVPIRAYAYPA